MSKYYNSQLIVSQAITYPYNTCPIINPNYCHKCIFIFYLFSIFCYLFLYLCHYFLCHAYAICYYPILYTLFFFCNSDQTLSIHYLFIIFSQPFLRFNQIYHFYCFQLLLIIPFLLLHSTTFSILLSSDPVRL